MEDEMLECIKDNNVLITLLFSFLVTLSTIIYAWLTQRLVNETIIMRRIQTDPKIQIDIIHDSTYPFIINISVKNIGGNVAKDIRFKIKSEPVLKNDKNLSQYTFIKNGISSLSPGANFKTLYFSTIDEGIEITKSLIEIEAEYYDLKKRKYTENSIFDLSYLEDLTITHTEPLYNINKTLEKINDTINKNS
jgi:hypothetical protein